MRIGISLGCPVVVSGPIPVGPMVRCYVSSILAGVARDAMLLRRAGVALA